MLQEINFDGIVGPSHNFSGLSLGNLAATQNAGHVAHPRDAAREGLAKMRANLALGLPQGILLPHDRPNGTWLEALATSMERAEPALQANAMSASPMWAANAATVSPAPDTADGRCHLTVANLVTMPHRSHEWQQTLAQLHIAFADTRHFAVHAPIPAPFGDEGAANHMRLASSHDAPGVEVFVYGTPGGPFPARQHREASAAVSRRHGLEPDAVLFVEQSSAAIGAGAFHNDVVAVANEHVLFAHEQAFADRDGFLTALRERMPSLELIEVPASAVSLADAIATYLFNAQLISLPEGGMALLLPLEARDHAGVWSWLSEMIARNGPIRRLIPVDVRQSMRNGGGPACLRLRVLADPATVDPRFLVDAEKLDRIEAVIARHWPERIASDDLGKRALWESVRDARRALLGALDLDKLG
jgi:succinylarginine dihydrolase